MKIMHFSASIGLAVALAGSVPVLGQAATLFAPVPTASQYQATAASTRVTAPRKHRKVYYGVGFGQHHRTTATGGNAGGYSDRN